MKSKIIIFLIFLLALVLRTYGLNWDQSQHLHPDERFLTMVATDIKLPQSISQYFNTTSSPLNPTNYPNYQFFVYGTFPLFLTKLLAVLFHLDSYDRIYLLGRVLSALFDSANIFLLYFLSKKRFLPSIIYAFTILPLQLSHFFTVDTFLTFFILATFTFLTSNFFLLAAIAFGFALACKISALYFLPIIILFLIKKYLLNKNIFQFFRVTCFVLLVSFLVFRIFQPYAFINLFTPNPQFINNLKTLASYNIPDNWFPPGVQWISKTPLLFSFQNLTLWSLGLPLFFLFLISIPKNKFNLILIWILLLFFFQGSQFVHTMRYFLPIIPFICLYSAKNAKLLLFFHILFGVLFLSIYSRPHSRVQASDWINQNITTSSVLSSEYWDDALPLGFSQYQNISLPLYDPDTSEKWTKINQSLNHIDYLIMSSNRLWGSIPLVPDRYPITSKFYEHLFSEKLAFKKVIEINSYPGISLPFLRYCYYFGLTNYPGVINKLFSKNVCNYPGIYIRDDIAEEAFTVYDHPKVLIFQNNFSYSSTVFR